MKKGEKAALEALDRRKSTATDVGISGLSHYELLVGSIHLKRKYTDVRELTWLEEAMKWLTVYEIDEQVVKMAAEIKSQSMMDGVEIPDMDL